MPCGSCFSRVALVGLRAAGSAVVALTALFVLAGLSPRASRRRSKGRPRLDCLDLP